MPSPAPTTLSRFRGALLGLAVGDALGTTVEFKRPGTFEPVTDMLGGGVFDLPAGAWTDDTSMALCLAESLLDREGFDPVDQLHRYVRWFRGGVWSSTGECFDIGGATRAALTRFESTKQPFPGDAAPNAAGNAPIMRLAPLAMAFAQHPGALQELAAQSCRTTHGAPQAIQTTQLFAHLLQVALTEGRFDLPPDSAGLHEDVERILAGSFRERQPPEIKGGGYIVEALEAALWALNSTETFEEGVLAAVNLGDDADTTAAIYGQIAGALYGVEAIPQRWIERLVMREEIDYFADRLYGLSQTIAVVDHEHQREDAEPERASRLGPYDSYWLVEKRVLAGPYPGDLDKREAWRKLGALLDAGVTCFVDLTEEGEGSPPLEPYAALLRKVAKDRGVDVTHIRMPIRDVDVPTEWQLRATLDVIRRANDASQTVYLHCWGGVGRTGTVGACHLIEAGHPPELVLERLAAYRAETERADRVSPETAAQRAVVEAWGRKPLTAADIPAEGCDYGAIERFAHTFNGYAYFDGDDDPRRMEIGAQWMQDGTLPADLDLLRAVLFKEFRIDRFTWGDDVILSEPDEEGVRHVLNNPDFEETVTARYRRALVRKIRELVAC